MTTDYSKKTNAELVEILKSRSLPHTGKKAEMVARLQENDEGKTQTDAGPAASGKTEAAEDVIDWEDDDAPADSSAAKPSTEAPAAAAGDKASADADQKQETAPAATEDPKAESKEAAPEAEKAEGSDATASTEAAPAPAEEKPAVDYTRGLPVTELEEELKKRKARAEKFGITEDSQAAIKAAEEKLERAKRFGTGAENTDGASVGVKRLDEALPDEKTRKRRNDNEQQGGRGKRRDNKGRNNQQQNRRGNGNRNQNQGQRRGGNNNNNNNNKQPPKALSEKDALAMEARKKRFAAAA
ncbi:hypothetical protein ASPWEDRAFT_45483 [Aspergillus wentii DTO 134E9]|uniref:SAP domain-containing protein n=1 Tax=Aspergillus wentii DTO 134E9 TaxID=1073089 RepID=A0A1L9R9E6_ASPWE|nr:uncharacterized protein ASPWEDRAFT_45483 [Aspergillus wentii DTO 134E9]OJJ31540.1 hypothetical protein ASPWEDRAFT_45483 [Aspergillus wentii DTO 134E9]